jgi:sn-glycerol 3-phosphate transport system permease protein
MEKRVLFRSAWLPWLLVAPQMAVILVFFFWPASQAIWQSMQSEDAFGISTAFVGLENFQTLFDDPAYIESFKVTALFSVLVAGIGIALSLMLAIFADRILRGGLVYKTFLIIPYAVAPAIAGVLWVFMFSPSIGVVSYFLRYMGMDWNHLLNSNHALTLIVVAAVWKQISYNFLFFLAGLQSIPQGTDRGRRHRWRRAASALHHDPVSAAVAHHLLPAGDQYRLRLLRHLRDRACDDRGRARA